MPQRDDYGFLSNPINGLGIVRARTLLGNLRMWDIPRSKEALDIVINEIGLSPIPGLYMLFDERSEKKVYAGQSENIKNRISSHIDTPEDKIKNWDRVIIINDGRNASQSDLNDENMRLKLEDYLVRLFKINKYTVLTASSRAPSLSATQITLYNSFRDEVIILLTNKNKISKIVTGRTDDEVYIDETKRILERNGHCVQKWGKVEAIVDNTKTFVRAGSEKPKGWQVTFRGGKADSFISFLQEGIGNLLMPRGPVLLIPLSRIKDFVLSVDQSAFARDTIDIFIRFDESDIYLVYKGNQLQISEHAILKYPGQ